MGGLNGSTVAVIGLAVTGLMDGALQESNRWTTTQDVNRVSKWIKLGRRLASETPPGILCGASTS